MATAKKSTTKKTKDTKPKPKATSTKKKESKISTKSHIPVDIKPVPKGAPANKLTTALQNRDELMEQMAEKKKSAVSEKKRISITLTENQAEAIKILAKAHKCSIGELIGSELLIMYLSNSAEDMKFMALNHHDLIEQVIVGN